MLLLFGMNLSPGVFRPGVISLDSRPGDFLFGVLDGVLLHKGSPGLFKLALNTPLELKLLSTFFLGNPSVVLLSMVEQLDHYLVD